MKQRIITKEKAKIAISKAQHGSIQHLTFYLSNVQRAQQMPKLNQEMVLGFYLLFILLRIPSSFSSGDPLFQNCGGGGYTANDSYGSNLNNLLTFFASLNSTSFTTRTQGSTPDSVYGLFLCRGDISSSDCTSCIRNASQDVLSLCPGSKQATVWYDYCELRYSDLRFFSTFQNSLIWKQFNAQDVTNHLEDFVRAQSQLLDEIVYQAAYNSSLMFATGTAMNGSDVMVNGLAQCTRDLSKDGCSLCLKGIRDAKSGSEASQGGRVLVESCNFRYDVYPFFQGKPTVLLNLTASLPPPSAPTSAGGEGSRNIIIISIVISVVVAFLLILTACILFRRRSANHSHGMANPEELSRTQSLYFDLSMLRIATANFSDINKLGQGGFGAVYKAMLPNGQEIAVKRLSASSKQGIEELKNELLLVAKLQHRNLVRLQGVCLEEGEKLLVYEYMPNGSLDHLLFDPIKCKELNWERRFKIIGGIARGLLYLHEESHLKVIHRDLKASNVLLDANMKPKISDFGLARLFEGDQTQGITNRVVGTLGYMAPEYARRGRFSTKLDVYSYGILVLEIITGRKNSSFQGDSQSGQDLLSYTWKHWRNGTTLEIIDPSLGENYSRIEVLRCLQIALLCAQEFAANRPLMSSVFLMLNSPLMPLVDPLPPMYLAGLSTVVSDVSSSSRQSYAAYTSMSATSSMGSSGQSGNSNTPYTPRINQKGKEIIHSGKMSSKAFTSRQSQTAPTGYLSRD